MVTKTLSPELLRKMDAYWRAANCPLGRTDLSLRQSAAKKALKLAHIKPRLLGHWGATPGLNFVSRGSPESSEG